MLVTRTGVAVIGAGLAGLVATRHLVAAGVDVATLEAQGRVGGRTLTEDLGDGVFADHGGQWVSPGQNEILGLADELGVESFPSWDAGLTVHWSEGCRTTAPGLFVDDAERKTDELRSVASRLADMATALPGDAPWAAPKADEWDGISLRAWLDLHIEDPAVRWGVSRSLEGVFGGGPGETSLLAALAIIRSGAHEIVRLTTTEDLGPEQRFVGGAQQLCQRMADELGDRVTTHAWVDTIEHDAHGCTVRWRGGEVRAETVVVTLPPILAGRIRYEPALGADRDQLTQRVPMGWVIKVHCVYDERFWATDGLSGKVVSDTGAVRATADNSPPSGDPGILTAFIEGDQARRLAHVAPLERRGAVLQALSRYFGDRAASPSAYLEKSWGDDPYARGAYGGYWTPGVWTTYGRSLRRPIGRILWSGTETSTAWNGKMEGAVHAGRVAAEHALRALG